MIHGANSSPLAHTTRAITLAGIAALAGCAPPASESPPAGQADHETSANTAATAPPQHETVHYYISRLPDRLYVKTYGDAENPRPWYIAAEALGEIGKPAVPALIARLDSPDPYELKLALYALMLASQDPELLAETGGEYLRLTSVLTEESNAENRQQALDWWQRNRHLWPHSPMTEQDEHNGR